MLAVNETKILRMSHFKTVGETHAGFRVLGFWELV